MQIGERRFMPPVQQSENTVKKASVIQRGKKFFYPKSIPKERSDQTLKVCILLAAIIFIADSFTNYNSIRTSIGFYVFLFLSHILYQLLYRTLLIFEEVKHLKARYEDRYLYLLGNAYWFPARAVFMITFALLYFVFFLSTGGLSEFDKLSLYRTILCIWPVVYLLQVILDLSSSPLNDSLWIAKDNGLDYGSGMAYSFFFGYLNYILPKSGRADKNLKEMMQDYEADNKVKFDVYKMFILIPKSLRCFVSLEDVSECVELRKSLQDKIITVAGVRDRIYKNSVYTISTKNGLVYVCAEYATPLKTFEEVFCANVDHSDYYNKHKNDIILQFYLTLKRVLERRSVNDMCELIYYDDVDENKRDTDNKYHDVGEIILARLKELEKQKQKPKSQ